jgi:hypothetical protein
LFFYLNSLAYIYTIKQTNDMTQEKLNELKSLSKVPGKWAIVGNKIDVTLQRNYDDRLVDRIINACKALSINFDSCVDVHS